MVLSLVAAAVGSAYLLPRVSEFAWKNGFTWFGKTLATWAVVALLWDLLSNNGDGRDFDNMDLALTAGATVVIRMVFNGPQVM